MKIIIVGASGTMGKYLTSAFKKEHEIVRVGSKSGDVQVDITSPEEIENFFKQVGPFEHLYQQQGQLL